MKRRYRLLIGLFGVLTYLLILPRDLSTSFTITPESSFVLGSSESAKSGPPIPFVTSRFIGFLNSDGSPRVSEPVRYGAAVSSSGFLNYDSVSRNLLIHDNRGEMVSPVDTAGYPFFLGERLMVISTDRLRLKEYSLDGDLLWQVSAPSPITVCTGSPDRTLVGMLNGDFLILDSAGNGVHSFVPGDSRLSVAYGAGMDADAGVSFLVAGADPQMAYLLEERGAELRLIQQFELGSDLRRNVMVYMPLPSLFAVEQEEGLLLFDELTLKRRSVAVPGRVLTLRGYESEELLAVLSEGESGYFLNFFGSDNRYRGELTLPRTAEGVFIEISGDRLFLILGDQVMVYRLERV
jgi:hypothetical protein